MRNTLLTVPTTRCKTPSPRRVSCTRLRPAAVPVVVLALAAAAHAELPDGPGKAKVEKLCVGCHEIGKSVSLRQDKDGWSTTLAKMIGFGLKAGETELRTVIDYLGRHYPADALPPLNVNKARAIQFESRLSLKRSEAAKIIRYRKKNGDFKSIEDLRKVPGVDIAKIEAKQDSLVFLTDQTEPRP